MRRPWNQGHQFSGYRPSGRFFEDLFIDFLIGILFAAFYASSFHFFFTHTLYLFGDHISSRSQLYWEQRWADFADKDELPSRCFCSFRLPTGVNTHVTRCPTPKTMANVHVKTLDVENDGKRLPEDA